MKNIELRRLTLKKSILRRQIIEARKENNYEIIDIEINDQIEYKEDNMIHRHTIYDIQIHKNDIFIAGKKEKEDDTKGYSAFYWSEHGKGVKIIKNRIIETNFTKTDIKDIDKKVNYKQLNIFELKELEK